MNLPPPQTPTRASSSSASFSLTGRFRQHRQRAYTRLRTNLAVLVLATFAWYFGVWGWTRSVSLEYGGEWGWTILKSILLFLPLFNVFESVYALSLPPPTPVASPSRATVAAAPPVSGKTSTPAQRRLRGMPSSLPKVASLPSTPARGGLSHLANSTSTLNNSLNNSFSAADLSFGSSTSSTWSSPAINSSPLASYAGRHYARVGRPINNQSLSRLLPNEDDD